MIPRNPWTVAMQIVKMATLGCHLKGMMMIPFLFMIDIEAVNKSDRKVRIPPYMMSGLPKRR